MTLLKIQAKPKKKRIKQRKQTNTNSNNNNSNKPTQQQQEITEKERQKIDRLITGSVVVGFFGYIRDSSIIVLYIQLQFHC